MISIRTGNSTSLVFSDFWFEKSDWQIYIAPSGGKYIHDALRIIALVHATARVNNPNQGTEIRHLKPKLLFYKKITNIGEDTNKSSMKTRQQLCF